MRLLQILGIAIIGFGLAGCGSVLKKWENRNVYMVTAEDLDVNLTSPEALKTLANDNRTYVGIIVSDSETKCSQFLNNLVLAENSVNTGLDMITTVFSALGTAFSPVATIHALTAGATISGGWKTAIDADIYAKSSIGTFAQAIQATYYKAISDYLDSLTNKSEIVAALEVPRIQAIHRQCSLGAAEAAISKSLQGQQGAPPPPTGQQGATTTATVLLTVTGSVTDGDKITLTATSPTIPNSPVSVTYEVAQGNDTTKVATGLLNAVNKSTALADAKIDAIQASSPPGSSIILRSPASASVGWSSSPPSATQTETVNLTPVAMIMNVATPSAASGTTPSAVTKAPVPGSKIQQ